jgi:hypothetical protein
MTGVGLHSGGACPLDETLRIGGPVQDSAEFAQPEWRMAAMAGHPARLDFALEQ